MLLLNQLEDFELQLSDSRMFHLVCHDFPCVVVCSFEQNLIDKVALARCSNIEM